MAFNVGDKVRIVKRNLDSNGYCGSIYWNPDYYNYYYSGMSLFTEDKTQKEERGKMSLIEKFTLALTPEPQKSFRKAGITNGDDLLTSEGQEVFLSWLLQTKFAEEFKTAVVDDILKEKKKEEVN